MPGQFNVIKDKVEIEGDVRGLNDETKHKIAAELERIVDGLEHTFGVTCDYEFIDDYPALYNDPDFTEYVADTLKHAEHDAIQKVERCAPWPPSEDFAYYAKELPSAFIFAGAEPEEGEAYPHHHPKFNISETSMMSAAEAVGTVVLDYLNQDTEEK